MTRENLRATIPDELRDRVEAQARLRHMSKSELTCKAMEAYLLHPEGRVVEKPVKTDLSELERYVIMMRQKHTAEIEGLLGKIRVLNKRG